MKTKIYSRLKDIPYGRAAKGVVEGCLVLEGGAFRGLYTQGFLDAMMQHGLNLRCTVGVSAGALSGANYVAGQIGRSARINLGYRHDGRYVGLRAFLRSRSILDIGFLIEERGILEPLDEKRFESPDRRFVAVATDCLTGEPAYFEKGVCDDIMLAIRASATMPYISPPVVIDGIPYLDGGCSCKIPYEWALAQKFEKIVVIRTRDVTYRKPKNNRRLAPPIYRKYPEFVRRCALSDTEYNRQCDEIELLHAQGRLMHIAPSRPVDVLSLDGDMEKLGELYWLGWCDYAKHASKLKAYLVDSVGADDGLADAGLISQDY